MRQSLMTNTAVRIPLSYQAPHMRSTEEVDSLPRSLRWMIILAIVLGFCDESVRKTIPSHPILVTAVKDIVFCLAGVRLMVGTSWGRSLAALWLPWICYVLASAFAVWEVEQSISHLLGVIRTYIGPICLMAVGVHIGMHPSLLKITKQICLIGTLAAVLVAGLQEVARDRLPVFLATQILEIDGHSFAGGRYNESLFGAPQTLAICCMVASVAAFAIALYTPHCYVGSACLVILSFGIYLSRIRTVYLLMPVAYFFVYLLMRRWHTNRMQVLGRALMLMIVPAVAWGLFVGLGGFDLWARESGVDLAKEARYLEYLTETEEHRWRMIYFMTEFEMAEIPAARLPFGFGAGKCGSLRQLLPNIDSFVPEAHDTGVFLLTSELGIVGLCLFLGTITIVYARLWSGLLVCRPPFDAVWSFASSQVLFIWFLMKSYTIINNGFSQMLWFACLGIVWGSVHALPQTGVFMLSENPLGRKINE